MPLLSAVYMQTERKARLAGICD